MRLDHHSVMITRHSRVCKLEAEQKRIDDLAKERFDLFWS